jgi:hypothetical protein
MSINQLIMFIIMLYFNKSFRDRTVLNAKLLSNPLDGHTEPHNCDEYTVKHHLGNFLKTFPRNSKGLVSDDTYENYLQKIKSKSYDQLKDIQIAKGSALKPVEPLASTLFESSGAPFDSLSFFTPSPFNSPEYLGQLLEVYAMAIARDIPFNEYKNNKTINKLTESLNNLRGYNGPRKSKHLFRGESKGDKIGYYVSQFLLQPITEGCAVHSQQYKMAKFGVDFMTDLPSYLNVQNGIVKGTIPLEDSRCFITGRDLTTFVHRDPCSMSTRNAALILFSNYTTAFNQNIYSGTNMTPFNLFSQSHVFNLIERVCLTALNHAFYHKWYIHRRARPEEGGFALDQYDEVLSKDLDKNSYILRETHKKYGSYLLPQAYPEGCPPHPTIPQGHGSVAGAGLTILKAFFNNDFIMTNTLVPNDSGSTLVPYKGKPLTIGNELDKLGSNIAYARNFAGIHYREDAEAGLLLGEKVAIFELKELVEIMKIKGLTIQFNLTKRNGHRITIH